LEFLGETVDYADFTGRNRENLPHGTTDGESTCHETESTPGRKIVFEGGLQVYEVKQESRKP
jgi:hypothetical protein